MTGNVVARRYAKALFAVGQSKGDAELKAYGEELARLAGVLEESPEALRFFRNPLFSADEKKAALAKLADQVSLGEVMKNFCGLLADKDRLAVLPEIYASFQGMLDDAMGVLRGELVTVVDLPDDKKGGLLEKLESQTGKKLVLDFVTDKDILGGVVLKVGDKVLDASLKAQLQILKENITRGEQ